MECARLKTGMFFGTGKKTPSWTWMVATQVTDTPFMSAFMANLKKGALYWIHGNNTTPEQMNYNTQ